MRTEESGKGNILIHLSTLLREWLPRWLSGKEATCQFRKCRRHEFDPWVGKAPWRRKWQPSPVFLPGESHGQRSLAGYSPQGHKSWTRLSNWTTTTAYTPKIGFPWRLGRVSHASWYLCGILWLLKWLAFCLVHSNWPINYQFSPFP